MQDIFGNEISTPSGTKGNGKKKKATNKSNSKVSKTIVVEPAKIYISGSIKKSTGNYGTVDIQFGITYPVDADSDLKQKADEIFESVISEALKQYASKMYAAAKKLDQVIELNNRQPKTEDNIYQDIEF